MNRPTEGRPEPIVSARAWLCALPLPQPLNLGAISYRTRDYVVLELTSAADLVGYAMGYTRFTPLLEAAKTVCAHLAGQPADPAAIQASLAKCLAPGWSAFARAASLVDIALWDITAQRRGLPLAALLGANAPVTPLMAVAGYFSDTRSVAEVVAETQRFVDDGYTTLKLILQGKDRDADYRLLDAVRAAHPGDIAIAVDFHGAFGSVDDAMAYCTELPARGVRFVEDPFPSRDWHDVADFTRRSTTPVASGEDLVSLTGLADLLDSGIAYLRLDVTATGGYTTGIAALRATEKHHAQLAPHVWPHFHAPLAAASTAMATLEVIPDYVGADPLWTLLSEPAPIYNGTWRTPERPGLGLPLDLDAVSFHAADAWSSDLGGWIERADDGGQR